MAKKELNTTKIINILIIVVLASFAVYFTYNFWQSTIPETEIPRDAKYEEPLSEAEGAEAEGQTINLTDEEGFESWNWEGGGGGGGAGAGAGTDTGETTPPPTPPEDPDEGEEEAPSAQLTLLDFGYELIDFNTAKVNSITYTVENEDVGITNLELLIYIYDEIEDASKKGLVRDQIGIGQLDYGETITDTVNVDAYYNGNLANEKVLKITLIAYIGSSSYNIGSVTENVIFS